MRPKTIKIVMLVVGAVACGCATKIPIRDAHMLLDIDGDPKVSKNDVTVTVTSVDVRNYAAEVSQFTYEGHIPVCREEGGEFVKATVGGGGVAVYPVRFDIFEPCCTFKLRLENGTAHTISLAGATVQLEDGQGKTYELLQQGGSGGLQQGPNWPSFQKTYSAFLQAGNVQQAQAAFQAATQTIPIPGEKDKILPGKTKEFVLPFNATEAAAPLKLMLYDLVTATDAAGNPSVKDNFEFTVAKKRAELWRKRNDSTGQVEWTDADPGAQQCE